jgi:hypothetical protein
MSATRFYTMRSCNDDYVPIYMDPRFEADAKLEALDAKLEALCADYEKMLNGSEDDIIRPDFDDDDIERMEYREHREYKRFCQMNSFDEEEEHLIYDDIGEMTPRGRVVTNYAQFYESVLGIDGYNGGDVAPRGLKVDHDVCSECHLITKIVAYGWRDADDNLCLDCVNLPGMNVR